MVTSNHPPPMSTRPKAPPPQPLSLLHADAAYQVAIDTLRVIDAAGGLAETHRKALFDTAYVAALLTMRMPPIPSAPPPPQKVTR